MRCGYILEELRKNGHGKVDNWSCDLSAGHHGDHEAIKAHRRWSSDKPIYRHRKAWEYEMQLPL